MKKTDRGFLQIRNEKQQQQITNNNTCIKEEQINSNLNLDSNLLVIQNVKDILLKSEKSFYTSNHKEKEDTSCELNNYSKDAIKKTEKSLPANPTAALSSNILPINISNLNTTVSNNITNSNNNNIIYNPHNSNNNLTNAAIHYSKDETIVKKDEFKIGDFLQSKDIIYFELEFEEIWLEVEMSLTSDDNKSLIISFEIKIQVNELITNLTKLLIKMGIKSWAKYILDIESYPDYYLLTHFKYTDNHNSTYQGKSIIENQNFNNKEINNLFNSYPNGRSSFKNNNPNFNLSFDPKQIKNSTPNLNGENVKKANPENLLMENLNKNLYFNNCNNIEINGLIPFNENLNNDNYVNLSGCFDHLAEEEMDDFQGK